jgi:hypothetical protein
MPRGEKSGNPRMKRHRATHIAEQMRRRGAPRGEAYRVATAMMERDYDRVGPYDPRKMAVNEDARDSRTGQRKTNLSTKQPAVSGARQPSVAQHDSSSKRSSKKTGGGGKASAARKPRTSSDPAMLPNTRKSAAGNRKPPPWKAAGYRSPGTGKQGRDRQSKTIKGESSKRALRSTGPASAGSARKSGWRRVRVLRRERRVFHEQHNS